VEKSSGSGRRAALFCVPATIVAGAAIFLFLARMGAEQAAQQQRVLPWLDGVAGFLGSSGGRLLRLLVVRPELVATCISGIAAVVAVAAFVRVRRRALPVFVLGVAATLVAWGQALLLADRVWFGVAAYVAACLCALIAGIGYPIRRLSGFDDWTQGPPQASAAGGTASPGVVVGECLLVLTLTVVAMLSRLYALTELPSGYDIEMIHSTVLSRTAHGLGVYARDGFYTNTTGIMHLFTQHLFFRLFGASIYAVRLGGVIWGVAAVPILYLLVRRLAGVAAAVAAVLLLICAPEQQFWSRLGTNNFVPLTVLALVCVHLSLRMVRRLSTGSAIAAAIPMPVARFFYMPGIVMFLYPVAVFAHAAIFVRGAWRRAPRFVPVLAAGMALWVFSLSLMNLAVSDEGWRFINPVTISGHNPWEKQGQFTGESLPKIFLLQAVSVSQNLGKVLRTMVYQTGFSNWYQRADDGSKHRTLTNVGVAALAALGIAYLLGQIVDPRAFALLLWVGLGILPGLLSDDPADRRIALFFPALPVIAALLLSAAARTVRDCAGRVLGWVTSAVFGVLVIILAWTSLASQLLLPIHPIHLNRMIAFTEPIFAHSDMILHDLESGVALTIVLGNADLLTDGRTTPCLRWVAPEDWDELARAPQCDFNDISHRSLLSDDAVQARRDSFAPHRVTFLLSGAERSRARIELLQRLYPGAERRDYASPYPEFGLTALSIDMPVGTNK
jgi:hypothetical protein